MSSISPNIAVIIPCFRVKEQILDLLAKLKDKPFRIYLVDDKCPMDTGDYVLNSDYGDDVTILRNEINLGVGGAVKKGFEQAVKDGCQIAVKLDGDGQMDPDLISELIQPILNGEADYVKGNRFHNLYALKEMPLIRVIGNSGVSFINKVASGYWNIMDPSNGFIAIHRDALNRLPLTKIDNRFFFESDMLFRLSTIGAVVVDYPMNSKYAEESSNLSVFKVLIQFPRKYLNRFIKRIFYSYFLKDFNLGTMHLIFGSLFLSFGSIFGLFKWYGNSSLGIYTPTGTIMISVITIILGVQLLLSFLNYDVSNIPRKPISGS
jgi:dolichol-phosphate mannosyltransferase